jgi:hypothetical protein
MGIVDQRTPGAHPIPIRVGDRELPATGKVAVRWFHPLPRDAPQPIFPDVEARDRAVVPWMP